MIMTMILFMSGVNLIASAFDGILPGLVMPNPKGGPTVLGMVTSCAGIAMIFGGFMVDNVCEPFMSSYGDIPMLAALFGTGKGSGAALMMFIIGIGGTLICLIAGKRLMRYHYTEN